MLGAREPGRVVLSVHADGVRLWSSGIVRGGGPAVPVNVGLAGRETVTLVAEPHHHLDTVALADRADAKFTCT
ncbi:NPCBM/NEW2 domain-containing protein [Streptomyces sp. NPDC003401]